LVLTKCRITSSDAILPTFPKMALMERCDEGGRKQPHIWNHRPQFAYLPYNCYLVRNFPVLNSSPSDCSGSGYVVPVINKPVDVTRSGDRQFDGSLRAAVVVVRISGYRASASCANSALLLIRVRNCYYRCCSHRRYCSE